MTAKRAATLEQTYLALIDRHQIVTAGAAIVIDGKVAWTGHFGEQSPGVAASEKTQFDVASITKTVAAEVVLRLVDAGELSLDEAMSDHWVDPDIAGDPRHRALTPRFALNHTTGFLNWRFFSDDNQLRLNSDPGDRYGYSGEGFEYLAKFVERRTGRGFEDLVKTLVFEPMNMANASFSVRKVNFDNIVRAVDDNGTFHGHYCRPQSGWCRDEGDYSAADDLRITVDDYAKFLIAVMNAEGYSKELASERNRVQTGLNKGMYAVVDCGDGDAAECPVAQGYGLGWNILDYGENKLIVHGGSDWSEVALSYFYTRSRDGLIIFLNAPNHRALAAMPEAIEAIDSDSPMLGHYHRWLAQETGPAE